MRILHVCEALAAQHGGVPVVVAEISSALARLGHEVHVVAPDAGDRPLVTFYSDDVRIHAVPVRSLGAWDLLRSNDLRRALDHHSAQSQLVHAHGIWSPVYHHAAKVAGGGVIPQIISPHGGLDEWAFQYRAWKKVIPWRLQIRRRLRRASCVHVLTAAQAQQARERGVTAPLAVISNGVRIPRSLSAPDSSKADQYWPELARRRVVLFLSRIHPIKGLGHLLRAWAKLPEAMNDWHLVLAGADTGGLRDQLRALAWSLGIADRLTWTGAVHGERKECLWARAEVFVLPSFSEGQSCSMMEAAARALPILATPKAILGGLAEAGGGIAAPPDVASWAKALRCMLALPNGLRQAMGRSAQQFIENQYTWPSVAERMTKLYAWATGEAPSPAHLLLNSPLGVRGEGRAS